MNPLHWNFWINVGDYSYTLWTDHHLFFFQVVMDVHVNENLIQHAFFLKFIWWTKNHPTRKSSCMNTRGTCTTRHIASAHFAGVGCTPSSFGQGGNPILLMEGGTPILILDVVPPPLVSRMGYLPLHTWGGVPSCQDLEWGILPPPPPLVLTDWKLPSLMLWMGQ